MVETQHERKLKRLKQELENLKKERELKELRDKVNKQKKEIYGEKVSFISKILELIER